MSNENQVLVIDAGNTSVKVAVFNNGKLTDAQRIDYTAFNSYTEGNYSEKTIISSVLSKEKTNDLSLKFDSPLIVGSSTKIPITIEYTSKNTLGIDRICNAVFAASQIKEGVAVVIDIGTCVKFDLVDSNKNYLGGSISPGIDLRYKSLNDYTGNLPLLDKKEKAPLVGTDTKSSIHSGVINGIKAEIHRLMEQYSSQFNDLTFFVTGGDARYFDLESKNGIFADENLTLKGLYEIYRFNA